VRRMPIIQRGPRPMWVRKPPPAVDAEPVQAPPAPAPSDNGSGAYRMPRDLVPAPTPGDFSL